MINEMDRRIVRYWQNEPSISRRDLAEQVGVSLGVLNRRVEALRGDGIIRARRAVIDWALLGFSARIFLRVTLDKTAPGAWEEFLRAAKSIAEIVVIETLVGRVDVRMDVMARDMKHYQEIYVEKILALPHIADIESLLMVSEIKNTSELPL